jgi:hypothetical protein
MKYPKEDVYAKADMEQMKCQKTIFKAPRPPKEVPKTAGEAPVKPSK